MLNFDLWNQLLHQYVDDFGRVDYRTWKAESSEIFYRWLAQLEQLTLPENAGSDDRLALWVNLYNAFTIAAVLQRYPLPSILPKILGIPNWLAFLRFFTQKTHKLAGSRVSLNQIEHQILRREFEEPRIHFALVCASTGCPLLRPEAYRPNSVRRQLEEDATRFINNPDKVRYDIQTGTLYCSKIFLWYGKDFLKVSPSVGEYIRSYLKTGTPITSPTPIVYLDYDWSLNELVVGEPNSP